MVFFRAASWKCLAPLSVALIGVLTTGCYTTTKISPLQAMRLDYRFGPSHMVTDEAGVNESIGDSFTVSVTPRGDLPPAWGVWARTAAPIHSPVAIEVRGPMLFLQGEKDAHVAQIPLAYIEEVRVRELSPGKTAGLAVGVTLGAVATAMLTALVVVLATIDLK
jgi:hypothetical protein